MTETLAALGRRLDEGNLTSEALVDRCLERIASENAHLQAFSKIFAGEARADARQLDHERKRGEVRGPLHGLPIAVKDLADIEGQVTGFGSRAYSTEPARRTAAFVRRLKDAGAIIVGTTHMVEFAFGSWGTNYSLGSPRNPVDRAKHRVTGGSSSGSAVAVAAGLVPAAIGSDTGGSIRIPAALCGIVGFKSSIGLVSTDGVAPLSPTFDTIGPLTRSVEDARICFMALSGLDLVRTSGSVGGKPLAIVDRSQLQPLDPLVSTLFEEAVARLKETFLCSEVRLPADPLEYQSLSGEIMAFEAYAHLRHLVEDEEAPIDLSVRHRVLAGRDIDRDRYDRALRQKQEATAKFREFTERYDAIVLPTTPLPAVPLEDVDETLVPMSRLTRAGNYLDLCGISLPLFQQGISLPAGLQLLAGTGRDADLLRIAEQVETEVRLSMRSS